MPSKMPQWKCIRFRQELQTTLIFFTLKKVGVKVKYIVFERIFSLEPGMLVERWDSIIVVRSGEPVITIGIFYFGY